MKYLFLLYADEGGGPAPGTPEAQAVLAAYGAFFEEVDGRGAFLSGDPVQPSSTARTVTVPRRPYVDRARPRPLGRRAGDRVLRAGGRRRERGDRPRREDSRRGTRSRRGAAGSRLLLERPDRSGAARTGGAATGRTLSPHGRLAQLGEHLPYKQGVGGSSPSPPTREPAGNGGFSLEWLLRIVLHARLWKRVLETPWSGSTSAPALPGEVCPVNA